MILHLGVIEQPYAEETVTTGDVAEILEDKYEVMGGFFYLHRDDINESLCNGLAGAVEALMSGVKIDPFGESMSKIQSDFKKYLEREEIVYTHSPGTVPTKAALLGQSKRKKHKYAKGERRPSFIDTGIYESSFIAWIEP